MELITKNAEETKSLGRKVAGELKEEPIKILALSGDLGSGKTTFTQGVAEGLGLKNGVISPTFILLRKYELEGKNSKVKNLYHLDLYRLEENIDQEVKNLGIDEIIKNPENIVVIEWAEKIKGMIPEEAKWISFESLEDNKRRITIK